MTLAPAPASLTTWLQETRLRRSSVGLTPWHAISQSRRPMPESEASPRLPASQEGVAETGPEPRAPGPDPGPPLVSEAPSLTWALPGSHLCSPGLSSSVGSAVSHTVRRRLCTLYLQEEAHEQISRVTRENVWLPWVGIGAICSQVLRKHWRPGRVLKPGTHKLCVPGQGPRPLWAPVCFYEDQGAGRPCDSRMPPTSLLPGSLPPFCTLCWTKPLLDRGGCQPSDRGSVPPSKDLWGFITIGLIGSQAENNFIVFSEFLDNNSPIQKCALSGGKPLGSEAGSRPDTLSA